MSDGPPEQRETGLSDGPPEQRETRSSARPPEQRETRLSDRAPASPSAPPHFADRLVTQVRKLGHPLCVGLDPHLAAIPAAFARGSMQAGDPASAEAVDAFHNGRQSAFFEIGGKELIEAMERGDIATAKASLKKAYATVAEKEAKLRSMNN